MIKVFIDSMIYNFTPFKSFFFLTNINSRSFIYNLTVGLFVDIFVIHSFPLNTIFMCIVYLLHKYLKINYYNVINNISFCQKHTTYTPNVASQKIIEDLHYLRLFIHIYFVE